MVVCETFKVSFPEWALSYLVNNDPSGLNDDEIAMVDKFDKEYVEYARKINGHVVYHDYSERYFDHHPEFGLACDCCDLEVSILRANKLNGKIF